MLWLMTLTALADPWALPTKPEPTEAAAESAPTEPSTARPPARAMTEIRTVPPAGLLYRTEPNFIYPSHRATPQPVQCHASITWASNGSLESAYTPVSSTCPIAFAKATSEGLSKAAIEPFTPRERVHTDLEVRMVLQGTQAPPVQDIYRLSEPLDALITHCALVVELSHKRGAVSVQSTDRERCSFEPRGRMKVSKSLLKTLEAEATCELRATAQNWTLTDPTFTSCPDHLRHESGRIVADWVVVQSPSPKHIYDVRLVFPGPR